MHCDKNYYKMEVLYLSTIKKGRLWACVGYPESLPTDWIEKLTETGLQIAISPLHDKDLDPTGEEKKPHYHIIFVYEGPTTYNHVKELCSSLNMTIPIKLESLRGMYRYHIHIDNPDKYQYNDNERILLNGFDKGSVDNLTETQIDVYQNELIDFIVDNNIFEYSQLILQLKQNELFDLLKVAKKSTIFFVSFIKSYRFSQLPIIDIMLTS